MKNKLNVIYVIKVRNDINFKRLIKVGYTSIPKPKDKRNLQPNSNYLIKETLPRTQSYMNTANFKPYPKDRHIHNNGTHTLYYSIEYVELAIDNQGNQFKDYPVHRVLDKSGYKCQHDEWYIATVQNAQDAIKAVKNKQHSIKHFIGTTIRFRPEQIHFINQTIKRFKCPRPKINTILWNAKMRFGKTLCALDVAKKLKYKHILIITHRPVVNRGWYDDFNILFHNSQYNYGSQNSYKVKRTYGESLSNLNKSGQNYFYFVSLQYLVRHRHNLHSLLYKIHWNLLIIDEAHEGAFTNDAHKIIKHIKHKKTLLLSGTPFNLLPIMKPIQVLTWNYIDEQSNKQNWSLKYGNIIDNPYKNLPQMKIYRFSIGDQFKNKNYINKNDFFNFNEFFRVNKQTKKFIHENDIKQFLKNIYTPSNSTKYPYSTSKMQNKIKNALWILPSDNAVNSLAKLLKKSPSFNGYRIINLINNGINDPNKDVEYVKDKIHATPTKPTITLTVRKMTLGVTIPEWNAVIFLSGTKSLAEYLQAAFRAQSPANNKHYCYIYDFSPNRVLYTIALLSQRASSWQNKLGKRASHPKDTKQYLKKLIHFMPIISKVGNHMKPMSLDMIMNAIHKNNAESAFRSGFYTDKLLNFDKLNNISYKDKTILDGLKDLDKQSSNTTSPGNGIPTHPRIRSHPRKSNKTNSSKTDSSLMQQEREYHQDLKTLKSITARIPLILYGLNLKLDKNFKISKLPDEIDNKSWNNFMPPEIDKDTFKHIAKFYVSSTFTEAIKIFKQNLKRLDKLDPIIRTNQIAHLLSKFRNPDNQDIITPWRTINNQLGNSFGGLSYYSDNYSHPTNYYWIKHSSSIFKLSNLHILEVSSRTGLYSLYMATSLYYQILTYKKAHSTSQISDHTKHKIWLNILHNHIYIIAQSKMAVNIAIRTLIGYDNDHVKDVNIIYKPDLISQNILHKSKESSKKAKVQLINDYTNVTNDVERDFGTMHFNVVVGNPPYQQKDPGKNKNSASPIFQYFVRLSEFLSQRYVSLIIPAKWYIKSPGLNKFKNHMLNDKHIKEIWDYINPKDVFPKVHIRGGICIFLWDKEYNNQNKNNHQVKVVNINGNHTNTMNRSLLSNKLINVGAPHVFFRNNKALDIIYKVLKNTTYTLSDIISSRNPFNLPTSFWKNKHEFKSNLNNINNPVKVYASNNRVGYTNKKNISGKYEKYINSYKIFASRSCNISNPDMSDDNLNTILGQPNTVCTDTYIVIGVGKQLTKSEAINLRKYLSTKFVRYLISLIKIGINASRNVYKIIPLQNFSNQSHKINWNTNIKGIDEQLFKQYNLTEVEQKLIKTSIKVNGKQH